MSCTFHGFVAIRKSFSVKFGDVVSFGAAKVSNLESFFHKKKIIIFTSLREFFPSKVSCYIRYCIQNIHQMLEVLHLRYSPPAECIWLWCAYHVSTRPKVQ